MIGVQNLSVIVNFCDWLDKTLSERKSSADFIDYAYDEERSSELRQYAQEYLQLHRVYDEPDGIDAIRKFCHLYIDSPVFTCALKDCFQYVEDRNFLNADAEERLWYFFRELSHRLCSPAPWYYNHYDRLWEESSEIRHSWEQILKTFPDRAEKVRFNRIYPESLAETYRQVFRNMRFGEVPQRYKGSTSYTDSEYSVRESRPMVYLMTKCQATLRAEADFANSIVEPVNFSTMPKKQFERIVDDYLKKSSKQIANPEFVKKQLIKCFMHSKTNLIIDRLTLAEAQYKFWKSREEYAPENWDAKQTGRNLDKLIKRYHDRSIRYRCFISHANVMKKKSTTLDSNQDYLETNQDYENFIKTYWMDLNRITGNFLDVYYDDEYGISGQDIVRTCSKIPKELRGRPLLVLWEDDVTQAEGIDIHGLTKKEIHYLIVTIVEYVKAGYSFSAIIKEANKVAEQERNENRPVQINAKNVGSVYGAMSGGHVGDNVGVQTNELTELLLGFTEAKARINVLAGLDEDDRDLIVSYLERIETAVRDGNDEAKEKDVGLFRKFLNRLGETGPKVISALAGIASIAKFFGFGV